MSKLFTLKNILKIYCISLIQGFSDSLIVIQNVGETRSKWLKHREKNQKVSKKLYYRIRPSWQKSYCIGILKVKQINSSTELKRLSQASIQDNMLISIKMIITYQYVGRRMRYGTEVIKSRCLQFCTRYPCKAIKQRANVKANQTVVPETLLQLGPANSEAMTYMTSTVPLLTKPMIMRRPNTHQMLSTRLVAIATSNIMVIEGQRVIFRPNL